MQTVEAVTLRQGMIFVMHGPILDVFKPMPRFLSRNHLTVVKDSTILGFTVKITIQKHSVY